MTAEQGTPVITPEASQDGWPTVDIDSKRAQPAWPQEEAPDWPAQEYVEPAPADAESWVGPQITAEGTNPAKTPEGVAPENAKAHGHEVAQAKLARIAAGQLLVDKMSRSPEPKKTTTAEESGGQAKATPAKIPESQQSDRTVPEKDPKDVLIDGLRDRITALAEKLPKDAYPQAAKVFEDAERQIAKFTGKPDKILLTIVVGSLDDKISLRASYWARESRKKLTDKTVLTQSERSDAVRSAASKLGVEEALVAHINGNFLADLAYQRLVSEVDDRTLTHARGLVRTFSEGWQKRLEGISDNKALDRGLRKLAAEKYSEAYAYCVKQQLNETEKIVDALASETDEIKAMQLIIKLENLPIELAALPNGRALDVAARRAFTAKGLNYGSETLNEKYNFIATNAKRVAASMLGQAIETYIKKRPEVFDLKKLASRGVDREKLAADQQKVYDRIRELEAQKVPYKSMRRTLIKEFSPDVGGTKGQMQFLNDRMPTPDKPTSN